MAVLACAVFLACSPLPSVTKASHHEPSLGDLEIPRLELDDDMEVVASRLRASGYFQNCPEHGLIRTLMFEMDAELPSDHDDPEFSEPPWLETGTTGPVEENDWSNADSSLGLHYSVYTQQFLVTTSLEPFAVLPPPVCTPFGMSFKQAHAEVVNQAAQWVHTVRRLLELPPAPATVAERVQRFVAQVMNRLVQDSYWWPQVHEARSSHAPLYILEESGDLGRFVCAAVPVDLEVNGYPMVALTSASCIKPEGSISDIISRTEHVRPLRLGHGVVDAATTIPVHVVIPHRQYWENSYRSQAKDRLRPHDVAILLSTKNMPVPRLPLADTLLTQSRAVANPAPSPTPGPAAHASNLSIITYGRPQTGFPQTWTPRSVVALEEPPRFLWNYYGTPAAGCTGCGGGAVIQRKVPVAVVSEQEVHEHSIAAPLSMNHDFLGCVQSNDFSTWTDFGSRGFEVLADHCPDQTDLPTGPFTEGTRLMEAFGRTLAIREESGRCRGFAGDKVYNTRQLVVSALSDELPQFIRDFPLTIEAQYLSTGPGAQVNHQEPYYGVFIGDGHVFHNPCPHELPRCEEVAAVTGTECACHTRDYEQALRHAVPRFRNYLNAAHQDFDNDETDFYSLLKTMKNSLGNRP